MLGASSGVPQDIESFMVQYGYPVPVDLAAGAGQFEDYSGGIYDACVANAPVDHIVAIVGWANEGNKLWIFRVSTQRKRVLDREKFLGNRLR